MLEIIEEFLRKKDVKYLKEFEISKLSSIALGGRASIVAFVKDATSLCQLVEISENLGIKYFWEKFT